MRTDTGDDFNAVDPVTIDQMQAAVEDLLMFDLPQTASPDDVAAAERHGVTLGEHMALMGWTPDTLTEFVTEFVHGWFTTLHGTLPQRTVVVLAVSQVSARLLPKVADDFRVAVESTIPAQAISQPPSLAVFTPALVNAARLGLPGEWIAALTAEHPDGRIPDALTEQARTVWASEDRIHERGVRWLHDTLAWHRLTGYSVNRVTPALADWLGRLPEHPRHAALDWGGLVEEPWWWALAGYTPTEAVTALGRCTGADQRQALLRSARMQAALTA